MFDDQPLNNSGAPGDLPMGEPQDIFAGTEAPAPSVPLDPGSVAEAPSALSAGILKPKPTPPSASSLPPLPGIAPDTNPMMENTIKEPTLSRGIMIAIMATVIGFVLIGSGWFAYRIFTKEEPSSLPVVDKTPSPTETEKEPTLPTEEPTTPAIEPVSTTTDKETVDEEILLGEIPDTDGDGLKDNKEKEFGTDPNNWDSDKDELADGDEVLIWHTNPNNPDTDGDTYKDAAEIKAGYNPAGPGRIGEVQSSTTTVSSSVKTDSTTSSSVSVTKTSGPVSPTSPEFEL